MGTRALFVEGDNPTQVHRDFATSLENAYLCIRDIQTQARESRVTHSSLPKWPALVLRTPKGWTGPKSVDGISIEGTFRSHQVPLKNVKQNQGQRQHLEQWMKSYRPEELFDSQGRLIPALKKLNPMGNKRMGASPHANGESISQELILPNFREYQIPVTVPGSEFHESTRQLGKFMRDIFTLNETQQHFRLFCPDETNSNHLGNVFETTERCFVGDIKEFDEKVSAHGRVMEVLSEHNCHGWLEGYTLTGRHGLFATYEAFATVVDSMTVQHAKWLEHCEEIPWRLPVPSLNYLLTSTCWRNDHNGFSHQGPGFIDNIISKRGTVARVYLPPDANCLLSVADHCLRSKNYLNLIVIDEQPQLQWLTIDEAISHCSIGGWNMGLV